MRYYRVPAIGTGIGDDPIRPDIPANTPWVGNPAGLDFLIKTPKDLMLPIITNTQYYGETVPNAKKPQISLESICSTLGISFTDVNNVWNVG